MINNQPLYERFHVSCRKQLQGSAILVQLFKDKVDSFAELWSIVVMIASTKTYSVLKLTSSIK